MDSPEIAFFDMDHTILATDCDVSWKKFLADEGLAPEEDRELADRYWDLYHQGRTPIEEFVRFQLREFAGRTTEEIRVLTYRHFEERIRSFVYPDAQRVIQDYASRNIPTVLVTGTNWYIAEPVAEELGITHVLATEPEIVDGRFTGDITGPFLLKDGKLKKAGEYCEAHQSSLDHTAFYADSINDLEMLEKVGFPVAVNPARSLLAEAQSRGWRVEAWTLAV